MAEKYKRWYDHDPLLVEVMDLLRNFKDDLRDQAEIFLIKIENQVGKDAIESFYEKVKPANGNRWYDYDPVLSRAVELLRIVPQDIQRKASENFLKSLKDQGISVDIIKNSVEE
ncbi:MAG TPA: hypothetical protein P5556_11040 [Candidatus Gastranaerophilales bacterium]|nr:hypothetical protein [Candidatus Gastranaerophilales bacterium]